MFVSARFAMRSSSLLRLTAVPVSPICTLATVHLP